MPPFEALLGDVVEAGPKLRGEDSAADVLPRSMLLSLSATSQSESKSALQIDERDLDHPVAGKRLNAVKKLRLVSAAEEDAKTMPDRLARAAWKLTGEGTLPRRIIVFCSSRNSAIKAKKAVTKFANGHKKADIPKREIAAQLFVGARRVRERQALAEWLGKHGFIAGISAESTLPSFVFATSAGEVGVDLDADHMVGDLVAFERMVQRFGRVNRRGEGEADIHVLIDRDGPMPKKQWS